MGASTSTMGWLRRGWLGVLVAMGLLATPSAAGATTTVALEKPLATIYYMHAGACASTLDAKSHPTYNLPSGVSATGIAFDGAGNLYVSCWGDNTIDQINIATRAETVYRISGGTGFGALTYHGGVLWACNGHTDGVGTIQLNASAQTGVFTSAFTAANSACTDALAFDPTDSTGNTIWMGTDVGNTPGQTGKTLDKFVSGRLSASKSVAGTIGHRSGIVATPTSFVLAQPVGGPNSIF
ncbi:MAG: hypothetical protein ACTHQQ_07415, partial [Solirubrobacteraceae bacterium]